MFPFADTKEKTFQFEFGPDQSVQVWPAREMPDWMAEPTGWIPPSPESQIMLVKVSFGIVYTLEEEVLHFVIAS
jgi:hypothetical protein